MTAPKHFEAFAVEPIRCKALSFKYAAAVTTASVQNEVNFVVVLVTAHAWRLVETHFEFPTSGKSGPTAMSAKSGFVQQWRLSVRRNAWRNFRGFRHRVWPTFEPPQRSSRTTLQQVQDLQQSAGQPSELFAERVALNLKHVAWRLVETEFEFSRDPAKASRPRDLKIDSGEKSFPLEVANQLARYF